MEKKEEEEEEFHFFLLCAEEGGGEGKRVIPDTEALDQRKGLQQQQKRKSRIKD